MLCPAIGSDKRKNGRQLHDVEAPEPSSVTLTSGFGPGTIEPASGVSGTRLMVWTSIALPHRQNAARLGLSNTAD